MNWIIIEQLNTIYREGKAKNGKMLVGDPDIQHLLHNTRELLSRGETIVKGKGFDEYYEQFHKTNYSKYRDFLNRNNLRKPQTRFEETDIQILMDIEEKMGSGDLVELRNQIIDAHETVRGVSLMFFRNEKYLLGRYALIEAVKQLLGIEKLADERDQQYKYVLECANPEVIVLCENIDFLKRPHRPRQYNIELWYAGGKNINKLDYADARGLPIYYSCDWDYDGLKIYEQVKQKITQIRLLYPTGGPRSIDTTEHKSLWQHKAENQSMHGFNLSLFSEKEKSLIQLLGERNQWIVEESNDLIVMVNNIRNEIL